MSHPSHQSKPPELADGYQIDCAKYREIPHIQELISAHADKLVHRTQLEIRANLKKGRVWVVREIVSDAVVGCVMLDVYSKRLCEVRSLAVDANHRRQKIGESLVHRAVSEALRLRIKDILAITDNLSFFERAGFGVPTRDKFAVFYGPQREDSAT